MKIDGRETQAFALAAWMSAVAQHAKPDNSFHPAVQILGAGPGISVAGVTALQALRDAIDFALDGPADDTNPAR